MKMRVFMLESLEYNHPEIDSAIYSSAPGIFSSALPAQRMPVRLCAPLRQWAAPSELCASPCARHPRAFLAKPYELFMPIKTACAIIEKKRSGTISTLSPDPASKHHRMSNA